jgi:4'-phosphopantetheinyl transferase EntD
MKLPCPDSRLQDAIERLTLPGVMIGYRLISPGDERALLSEEALDSSDSKTSRARGAARIVARELLSLAEWGVPNGPSGAPIWPRGIVGSLAHDSDVAVAAVALQREFASIGIDIEPAEALPPEVVKTIATPREQLSLNAYVYGGRLLFVAKEAVFKAVADLDHIFLDHHDVEVDFTKHEAVVRNGRSVELRFCISTHLLALAFVRRVRPVQRKRGTGTKSCLIG